MVRVLDACGAGYTGSSLCWCIVPNGHGPAPFDSCVTDRYGAVLFRPLIDGDLLEPAAFGLGRDVGQVAALSLAGQSVGERRGYRRMTVTDMPHLLGAIAAIEGLLPGSPPAALCDEITAAPTPAFGTDLSTRDGTCSRDCLLLADLAEAHRPETLAASARLRPGDGQPGLRPLSFIAGRYRAGACGYRLRCAPAGGTERPRRSVAPRRQAFPTPRQDPPGTAAVTARLHHRQRRSVHRRGGHERNA